MEDHGVTEDEVGEDFAESAGEEEGVQEEGMRRGEAHARANRAGHARPKRTPRRDAGVYSPDFRLRVVKLRLEEGLQVKEVCRATGVGQESVHRWVRQYLQGGEGALQPKRPERPGRAQLPPGIKTEIVALKRENPNFGVKRISQFLQRMLHLPGSPETVRRTLHREGLIAPAPVKQEKSPPKPRFFERSTPNQLWQTDIFTFRLAGKNAYLIGFIDDYSRYIVGLEIYRSQNAENVMEVYRRAVGEYGVPREMLSDNGRQFAAWRGTTRFQEELRKDKVHHIRSRPHHPMTLGKIERFWKNIWEEFLCRAQFDSFESARERGRFWVQYYNHRRPHQEIGGLCPADRFFEIRSDMRKVIDRGVQENVRELALRGTPQRPFYMVGRLDNQSVVMQAVKGKLVMTVNDHQTKRIEQMVCNLNEGTVDHDRGTQEEQTGAAALHRSGEVPVGADAVDTTADDVGTVPGTGGEVGASEPVAGTGHGGNAAGAGAETAHPGESCPVEPAPAVSAGTEGGADGSARPGAGAGGEAADGAETVGCAGPDSGDRSVDRSGRGDGPESRETS